MSLSILQQLQAGELTSEYRLSQQKTPIVKLQIAEGLTEFPKEILALADSLEVLDLSDNHLSKLPDELDLLVNMRILFLTNNDFEHIPTVLARCPKLEMISFKSNRLITIGENVLPVNTRWLILTDNAIQVLPESMGKLKHLQKLALAGNCLRALPASMAACHNLELVRLSANQLTSVPDWIFQLPKLAWLAFSGNEFNRASNESSAEKMSTEDNTRADTVVDVSLDQILLGELLGQGASGLIYRGDWIKKPQTLSARDDHIAVKIFKGDVTSDGYPQDELDCCLRAGEQENLIKVVAKLDQKDVKKTLGLVMELIPSHFYNLGLPPSLVTCTRDTFNPGTLLEISSIRKIAAQMTDAMKQLHNNGISHGDIYAHNIMINKEDDVLFGDFGAATNLRSLPSRQQKAMERIEVRAFGCLLDDLLQLSPLESKNVNDSNAAYRSFNGLIELKERCMFEEVALRPGFEEIQQFISNTLE